MTDEHKSLTYVLSIMFCVGALLAMLVVFVSDRIVRM